MYFAVACFTFYSTLHSISELKEISLMSFVSSENIHIHVHADRHTCASTHEEDVPDSASVLAQPYSFPLLLLPDKKDNISGPPAVVMPTPSKRGRKSKQMMGRVTGVGGVLPPGSDALILAHLAAGGQVMFSSIFMFYFYSFLDIC